MALKDTAKEGANTIAQNAQVAAKLAQAQLRKRTLAHDLKDAESQLGAVVLALASQGKVEQPELAEPIRRVEDAQALLHDNAEEIERLKGSFTTGKGPSAPSGDDGDEPVEGEVV